MAVPRSPCGSQGALTPLAPIRSLGRGVPQCRRTASLQAEREPDVPPEYYVTIDSGITETISEDWLEPAPAGSAPPPVEEYPWPT